MKFRIRSTKKCRDTIYLPIKYLLIQVGRYQQNLNLLLVIHLMRNILPLIIRFNYKGFRNQNLHLQLTYLHHQAFDTLNYIITQVYGTVQKFYNIILCFVITIYLDTQVQINMSLDGQFIKHENQYQMVAVSVKYRQVPRCAY